MGTMPGGSPTSSVPSISMSIVTPRERCEARTHLALGSARVKRRRAPANCSTAVVEMDVRAQSIDALPIAGKDDGNVTIRGRLRDGGGQNERREKLDDPLGAQRGDLGGAQAQQPRQDLIGVTTERGARVGDAPGRQRKLGDNSG